MITHIVRGGSTDTQGWSDIVRRQPPLVLRAGHAKTSPILLLKLCCTAHEARYVLVAMYPRKSVHGTLDSTGFDTSLDGTPLSLWSAWLQNASDWRPTATDIVVVAPHPDDETLGTGGFIYAQKCVGASVMVISVTDGEAARPEVPDLAAVRRRELNRALQELGLTGADHRRVGLPDGAVGDREEELTRFLSDCIPEKALLVAPFQRDGHPDHDATGRACARAAARRGIEVVQYPIWSWFRGLPQLFGHCRARRFALTEAAQCAKRQALRHFRSQLEERPGGAIVPPHVLSYFELPFETFLA